MLRRCNALLATLLVISLTTPSFADFQYHEKSKVTGGSMMGAMKFAGVFSKDAKQVTQGMDSTISLKGNKMRREDEQGKVEIIDLDARRIVNIDSRQKTYSVVTFDEMRAQMEEAKRKAAEQQAKQQKEKGQVTLVPKIEITPGTGSWQLLDYTAKETKLRVEMEMQSSDPAAKGQTANMWVTSDSYVAPVKGHDELKRFYLRLAKELDWVPGVVFGGNAQVAPAMVEYRKSAATLTGMPLLTYMSMGMYGSGPGAAQNSEQNQDKPSMNPMKSIGGMFHKKKKDENPPAEGGNLASSAGAPPSPANSLMDMTTEVTSVSTQTVDASLFQIPAGFKQVESKNAPK